MENAARALLEEPNAGTNATRSDKDTHMMWSAGPWDGGTLWAATCDDKLAQALSEALSRTVRANTPRARYGGCLGTDEQTVVWAWTDTARERVSMLKRDFAEEVAARTRKLREQGADAENATIEVPGAHSLTQRDLETLAAGHIELVSVETATGTGMPHLRVRRPPNGSPHQYAARTITIKAIALMRESALQSRAGSEGCVTSAGAHYKLGRQLRCVMAVYADHRKSGRLRPVLDDIVADELAQIPRLDWAHPTRWQPTPGGVAIGDAQAPGTVWIGRGRTNNDVFAGMQARHAALRERIAQAIDESENMQLH